MRISDWSSDVCSSDLDFDARQRHRALDRLHYGIDRAAQRVKTAHRRRNRVGNRVQAQRHFGDDTQRAFGADIQPGQVITRRRFTRSEEHTSELQSLMRISYAVFCLKKKKHKTKK